MRMKCFCGNTQTTKSNILCGLCPIALWRKPLRNLELRIWQKWWPWLPFSEENIWMFSSFQFQFQSIFGYGLKPVFCSSKSCQRISCNSIRLRKGCKWNWGDQLNIALKNRIQIWFRLWKYLENICIFQMSKS